MAQVRSRVGQRFNPDDRVKKQKLGGDNSLPQRVGTVLEAFARKEKRGHTVYYYSVLWDDLKTPSIHGQNVLSLIS